MEGQSVSSPRIALAALNPHAGEGGKIGTEEKEILEPAVKELRQKNLQIEGPLPADRAIFLAASGKLDLVVVPYHDQALIPLKLLSHGRGVNITLGLPCIRTSPLHGTAFDIAGTGKADPASFMEALRLAATL